MVLLHLKKVLLVLCGFVVMVIFLFSTQYNPKQGHLVKGSLIHNGLTSLTDTISNWFENQVLGISYKERFCKHVVLWNKSSKYPPVQIVAEQLNIKDGDSVFINGIHCGEWNIALKGSYPNIKLYGVDKDPEAIAYVKELANGTYKVSQPFELDKSGFNVQFDHAIVDDLLHVYTPELQCKAITQMIPLLKAGGSLYIGKTYEKHITNEVVETYLAEKLHVQLLQKCYWSRNCLYKRSDIVEILYSKDIDLLNVTGHFNPYFVDINNKPLDISNHSSSIFIYKHILLTSDKDLKNNILPVSKYSSHIHNHICTHSESMNATKRDRLNIDREGIKKAVKDMKLRGLDMHK